MLLLIGASESHLTSEDIGRYSAAGDIDGLHSALVSEFELTNRVDGSLPLREELVAKGAGSHYSSAYKLDHDIEQLEYLSSRCDESLAIKLREEALPALRIVRERIPPLSTLSRTKGLYAFRPEDQALVKDWYNRAIYVPDVDFQVDLNSRPWHTVEENYEKESVVVLDDLLSPASFEAIREILMTHTVFYETKMPEVFGGYVGAIVEDGLHAKPLLRLAEELRKKMPGVLEEHELRYLWCYKYDRQFKGIDVHADEAAVNVNIWLTPDEANLDPRTGGLVVYLVKPPESASLEEYNQRGAEFAQDLLRQSNYANVTVPYRANRAVIFDSALFHKTDSFDFKPGYANRRINLTLLFGKMKKRKSIDEL